MADVYEKERALHKRTFSSLYMRYYNKAFSKIQALMYCSIKKFAKIIQQSWLLFHVLELSVKKGLTDRSWPLKFADFDIVIDEKMPYG